MALQVSGLWFSYINSAPTGNPNDGVFNVQNLPVTGAGAFDGPHIRSTPPDVQMKGTYTLPTSGKPDHITFTEDDPVNKGCTLTYDGDISTAGKDLIAKGKR